MGDGVYTADDHEGEGLCMYVRGKGLFLYQGGVCPLYHPMSFFFLNPLLAFFFVSSIYTPTPIYILYKYVDLYYLIAFFFVLCVSFLSNMDSPTNIFLSLSFSSSSPFLFFFDVLLLAGVFLFLLHFLTTFSRLTFHDGRTGLTSLYDLLGNLAGTGTCVDMHMDLALRGRRRCPTHLGNS